MISFSFEARNLGLTGLKWYSIVTEANIHWPLLAFSDLKYSVNVN